MAILNLLKNLATAKYTFKQVSGTSFKGAEKDAIEKALKEQVDRNIKLVGNFKHLLPTSVGLAGTYIVAYNEDKVAGFVKYKVSKGIGVIEYTHNMESNLVTHTIVKNLINDPDIAGDWMLGFYMGDVSTGTLCDTVGLKPLEFTCVHTNKNFKGKR